jgi:glyoxylase-like metal-dependent hydrolase (beta-lactamase superfamily II)
MPDTGAAPSSCHNEAPASSDLVRGRHSVGGFELLLCSDGSYLLDGGAMFGVVPKTLWSKRAPADSLNRITLGLNSTVVRTGSATVLIETGIGNKQPPKMREIHGNQELLPQSLAAAGVRPEEVTHVVNTHLHFDHCGWNTTLHPDGSVTPTFPNARYFAALGEVEHGQLQLERDAVSYISNNYDPLIASGQMTLLDPRGLAAHVLSPSLAGARIQTDPEIVPGVRVEAFPGHTASMLAVHIEDPAPTGRAHSGSTQAGVSNAGAGPAHACYIGDLIPTSAHLDITWCMGYDLDPLRVIQERKRFYSRAIPERWLVLFTHDHQTPAAHISVNEKGKPIALAASR